MVAPTTRKVADATMGLRPGAIDEDQLREYRLPGGQAIVSLRIVDATDEYQRGFADRVYECLAALDCPFAVVVDLRRLTRYPPAQREAYGVVRERLRDQYRRYHALTVYVADTDAQRGFVTAVSWVAKASPGSGRVFTDSWQAAYDRCSAALTTASDASS